MSKYSNIILNLINESSDHLNAEQIFIKLKSSEPKIVLATVYNNLNALCDKKLIRRIVLDGEADRYDKIKRHDHVICKTCGKLMDFDFSDLTENLKSRLNAEVFNYDLKVISECSDCKNRKKEK